MSLLVAIVMYAIGAVIATMIVPIVLGFAGAPGALLAHAVRPKAGAAAPPAWGILLTALGQAYVALAWVAFMTGSARIAALDHGWFGKGVVWLMVFVVTMSPLAASAKEGISEPVKNTQHQAIQLVLMLAFLAFFVFAFAPSIAGVAWSWVPYVGR